MTQPTVYLFDVDGTLITSGGAGRRALERVFEERFGRDDACDAFSFAGMTDRAIFRRGLETIGAPAADPDIDALFEAYLPILRDEVANAARYAVHPGIVAALEALEPRPGVAIGLGTGNVEQGARIKLERVELNRWFDFGGFGCDAEDRAELIAAGAARGAARLDTPVDACRVVVIGETPKDVAAAHANGAECVAVSTGGATFEALVDCGADHVFPSLAAPGAVEALLG